MKKHTFQKYGKPPQSSIAIQKSPCLIGDTSSNGCFSIVMLVFLGVLPLHVWGERNDGKKRSAWNRHQSAESAESGLLSHVFFWNIRKEDWFWGSLFLRNRYQHSFEFWMAKCVVVKKRMNASTRTHLTATIAATGDTWWKKSAIHASDSFYFLGQNSKITALKMKKCNPKSWRFGSVRWFSFSFQTGENQPAVTFSPPGERDLTKSGPPSLGCSSDFGVFSHLNGFQFFLKSWAPLDFILLQLL